MIVTLKRGDTAPPLAYTIRNPDTTPIDLTGPTVRFLMQTAPGNVVANQPATITSATRGEVAYQWAAADTANPGTYSAEFEITLPGGRKRTHPERDFIIVHVVRDVA